MNLNPKQIEQEVQNLLLAHPELADDPALKLDMLEGGTSAYEYLRSLVRRIGESEAAYAGTSQYVQTLRMRLERLDHRIVGLRELAKRLLEKAELDKLQLDIATLSMRNGGRKVIVTDEKLIPDAYMRIKKEPAKTKIHEAIDAGQSVPGAELANGEPYLVVKYS